MRRPERSDLGRLAGRAAARATGSVVGRVARRVAGPVAGRVAGPAAARAAAVAGAVAGFMGDVVAIRRPEAPAVGPLGDLRVVADPRGLERGPALSVTFDGRPVRAHAGETVGGALLAAGIRTLRETRFGGRPRGLLCGVGACHDCLVTVDGHGPVRACLTPAADGMRIATHRPGGPGFDPAGVDLRGVTDECGPTGDVEDRDAPDGGGA